MAAPEKLVTIAEAKNILKKTSKDRKELTYEQRIALEHAELFGKLTAKATQDLMKDLKTMERLEEFHIYKIVDLLPTTTDDVKAIFAKERFSPNEGEVKKILEFVSKHSIV